jgi:hypothetical protein
MVCEGHGRSEGDGSYLQLGVDSECTTRGTGGDNVVAKFDKFNMSRCHAAKSLSVGFLIDEAHSGVRPVVPCSDVIAQGWIYFLI